MTRTVAGLALDEREEAFGRVRLALVDHADGCSCDATSLTVDPLVLSDGAGGRLRIDGIGNVATLEAYRGRGLATDLLEVAIERMRAGDAVGSVLYGIDGFYEPLGWRTCGDERWVSFDVAPGRAERGASPEGTDAEARHLRPGDVQGLVHRYDEIASRVTGAAHRMLGGRTWSMLDPNEVLVVVRDGDIVGWAWRGAGLGARSNVQNDQPGAAAFLELQAVDVDAAWHVVQAARTMVAASDEAGLARLVTGAPDGHPLRELARSEWLDAHLVDTIRPHGGAMLLPFGDDALRVARGSYQFAPDRF